MKLLRGHGKSACYNHDTVGINGLGKPFGHCFRWIVDLPRNRGEIYRIREWFFGNKMIFERV
jgi:hypothetical protein